MIRKIKNSDFIIDVFLLFLLMHGFYIVPLINSSFAVVALVIFLGFFLKPKFLTDTYLLFKNKYIVGIYIFIFFMSCTNLLYVALHLTGDLSYLKNYISQLIQTTMILFVFSYIFYDKKENISHSNYAIKLLIWIFIIQSIIETIAFLVPEFAAFVHLFYKPDILEHIYEGYNGVRGLALTGSPGWGLAVGYGLTFLFFVKHYVVNQKIKVSNIIILLILVLGTFFAGRSGFLGAILGLLYFIFYKGCFVIKLRNILYGLGLLIISIVGVYVLFPSFSELLVDKVFPFVFEFYYKYEATGIAQTGSTNRLMEMWSIYIPEDTYIFGTGLFTDPVTGKYYMRTDVGYLRNLLFGGILWVIFVILYHFYISSAVFLRSKKIDFNTKLFIFFLLIYALILEAKAMTIGFNKYAFSILVFYFISLVCETKKYYR